MTPIPASDLHEHAAAAPTADLPEPREFDRVILPTLMVCVAILLVPLLTPPTIYDEGFALVNAARISGGDVPYRDFWTVYSPGQYYALAGVFRLFGEHMLAARGLDTLIRLAVCLQVYLLVRDVASRRNAALAAVGTAVVLSAYVSFQYTTVWGLCLSLAVLGLLSRALRTGSRAGLVPAAIGISVVGFVRQDQGAYLAVTALGVLVLAHVTDRDAPPRWIRRCALDVTVLVSVSVATAVVVAAPWLFSARATEVLRLLFVFPATTLPEQRKLPLPNAFPPAISGLGYDEVAQLTNWLVFWAMLATLAVAGITVVLRFHEASGRDKDVRLTWLQDAAIVGLLTCHLAQVWGRYDFPHAAPSMILCLIVGFRTAAWWGMLNRRGTRWALMGIVWPLVAALCWLPLWNLAIYHVNYSFWQCQPSLAKAQCVALEDDQKDAVRYVQAHTMPGEAIFVGNTRHDVTSINDSLFYFLADRPSATRYHEFHPGVTTTAEVQREIIDEISSSGAATVVLVDIPFSPESNGSAISSGVTILDEYIRAQFERSAVFSDYSVWTRRAT